MNKVQRRYGKCIVSTWRIAESWHPYPWRFSVQEDDKDELYFVGVPNYCETEHGAIMRGWYRSKWINDGSINKRYG